MTKSISDTPKGSITLIGAVVIVWTVLYVCIIEPLAWWGMRWNFLRDSPEILLRYGITDPAKERLHAGFAGTVLGLSFVCALLGYFVFAKLFVLAAITTGIYIVLTIIFYLNRRDNPVIYGWG